MCQILYTLYTFSHLFILLNETIPTNTELKYLAVLSLILTINMLFHQKTLETNG